MADLSQHDDAHEEGYDGHTQDEEFPAVLTAEGGRIHVHHGCHQALHTHKLGPRREERCYMNRRTQEVCVCRGRDVPG